MTSVCESVTERVALGTPLGDLAEHAAGCDRCRRLVAMPGKLSAVHHDVDPGVGFAARMTIGARHRIAVRRRRRAAASLASVTLACVAGVFVVTRADDPARIEQAAATDPATDVEAPVEPPGAEDDLMLLVELADTQRSRTVSAPWRRIERPLAPYQKLLEGVAQ